MEKTLTACPMWEATAYSAFGDATAYDEFFGASGCERGALNGLCGTALRHSPEGPLWLSSLALRGRRDALSRSCDSLGLTH